MRHLFQFLSLIGILIIPLGAQSLTDSLQSEIRLRTFVEGENVPLNGEVVYHVELTWPGELNQYKISEIKEPVINNLTTRGSGSSNRIITGADGRMRSVKEITFYFTPLEIGMAYVDGVTITYEDAQSGKTENLISARIGIKITDPLPDPSDNGNLGNLAGILFLIALMVIAGYFVMRFKRRQREQREMALHEVVETTEEKYLRMLKETIHLNSANYKDSLNDLAHLLAGYISETYQVQPLSLNEKELSTVLNDTELSDESSSKIIHFYSRVNLVRFAGEAATETDFHQLYDTVEHFLEKQKSRIKQEDR